jgi:hypothetical protein
MKRTIKIIFILLFGINGFGNDSIPSFELRKNEIQLSLAAFSHNDDVYHTFGYSRLFRLKRNAYLGFYGGVGYLPKNNDFFYKLGFTGYKLYAYTGRLQFVLKFRKTSLYTAMEYTYVEPKFGDSFYYGEDNQFMVKIGADFHLCKGHFSLTPQIGAGLFHGQDPYYPYYYEAFCLKVGLDIGFCF